MVVDHRVRLEHVAADLAAEADIDFVASSSAFCASPASPPPSWYSRFFSIFIAVALFLNCERSAATRRRCRSECA